MGGRQFWTDEERNILRCLYPNTPTKDIAVQLGRSLTTIYQHANSLGLKKSQAYLDSADASRLRRGDNVGAEFRFKKGQTPFNKGLRRPGWGPGRMKETQFKKGDRKGAAADNWCPVGTIRADAEGYKRIKVREWHPGENFGFGNTNIWPLLNRYVWEQHNGPIPKGHAVVFRNSDRGNCDISNLELISRKELMLRNTVHRLPKEIAQVVQLRGALNRKIRSISEKQNVRPAEPSV